MKTYILASYDTDSCSQASIVVITASDKQELTIKTNIAIRNYIRNQIVNAKMYLDDYIVRKDKWVKEHQAEPRFLTNDINRITADINSLEHSLFSADDQSILVYWHESTKYLTFRTRSQSLVLQEIESM